jgi:hypothetical protein
LSSWLGSLKKESHDALVFLGVARRAAAGRRVRPSLPSWRPEPEVLPERSAPVALAQFGSLLALPVQDLLAAQVALGEFGPPELLAPVARSQAPEGDHRVSAAYLSGSLPAGPAGPSTPVAEQPWRLAGPVELAGASGGALLLESERLPESGVGPVPAQAPGAATATVTQVHDTVVDASFFSADSTGSLLADIFVTADIREENQGPTIGAAVAIDLRNVSTGIEYIQGAGNTFHDGLPVDLRIAPDLSSASLVASIPFANYANGTLGQVDVNLTWTAIGHTTATGGTSSIVLVGGTRDEETFSYRTRQAQATGSIHWEGLGYPSGELTAGPSYDGDIHDQLNVSTVTSPGPR